MRRMFAPIIALVRKAGQLACATALVAAGIGGAFHTAALAASWVPPQSRNGVIFLEGDSLALTPTRWSEDQTKLAAKQAVNLLERAVARVRAAESLSDITFFTGAGDVYVQREWVYFAAEEVSFAFGLQELGAKNPWVARFSGCATASKLLSDWFNYYRTNLLNRVAMSELGGDPGLPQLKYQLDKNLAECRGGLSS